MSHKSFQNANFDVLMTFGIFSDSIAKTIKDEQDIPRVVDDDEAAVLAHLGKITHHVERRTSKNQAQRKAEAKRLTGNICQKLSPKQIDNIVAAINAGNISLPDLDLEHEDYITVWALADSGSAAHVADLQRHVPGAILRTSQGQARGLKYVTADGGEIKNAGEFDVVFKDPNGNVRKTTFQNAPVGLPIFSLNQVAKDRHRVILDEDKGVLIHKPSGT